MHKYQLTHLLKLLWLVEVGHLSTAEYIVDVLQEGLLHHLSVHKEEHRRLILHTRCEEQPLQVCRCTRDITYILQIKGYCLLIFNTHKSCCGHLGTLMLSLV